MDFDKEHLRVFSPSDSPGDTVTFGFLYFVDGEAWAAKTLVDVKARAPGIPFGIPSSVDLRFPRGGAVWCRGGGDQ
jgi:hypothetical protein